MVTATIIITIIAQMIRVGEEKLIVVFVMQVGHSDQHEFL